MASSGDGAGHLSSTSFIERGVTSTAIDNGPVVKGTGTRQVLNE
jgi:hypothetical protein